MRVEVRPLPQKRWHGKEGKESFTQPKGTEVLYDVETGRYATGLTPEEEEQYGKELGVDLSSLWRAGEAHPYWSSKEAWIQLPNRTIILETSRPRDYVKWKNMKASKFVANSQTEYDKGLWDAATHIIFDEEEDIQIKATLVQMKKKVYQTLADASLEEKANIVALASRKSIKNRSQNFIDVELDALVEADPKGVFDVIKLGKDEVTIRGQIFTAHSQGILTKEGDAYFYMSELLGYNFEQTVAFFKHPDNQRLKVAILQKIR